MIKSLHPVRPEEARQRRLEGLYNYHSALRDGAGAPPQGERGLLPCIE